MTIETDNNISLYAQQAGWSDPGQRAIAIAIALAESSGNTAATNRNTNGSTDYGLWQINSIHSAILASGQWSSPDSNANMAYQIFKDAGSRFTPWSTYNSGKYLVFLPRGKAAVNGKITGLIKPETKAAPQNALTDPAFWRRIAFAVIGAILLLWALFKMSGDNQLSEGTKSVIKLGVKAVAA